MLPKMKCKLNVENMFLLFLSFSLYSIEIINAQKTNVGLICENDNTDVERIFQLAINNANPDMEDMYLNGVSISIEPGNAFETSKKLCKMLRQNLVAVFGPTSSLAAKHAMSICDAKELPFIDTRGDFVVELPTINLHPHPTQLAVILKDLVTMLEWEAFTIIYECGEYLPVVNDLLQMYGPAGPTIVVRRYELDLNGDYRNVLRRIRNSGETSFIVVGSIETLPELLKQAQQVGLMTGAYRYIISDLDLQTIDLEPYQHSDANITGIRLISPENELVLEVAKALYEEEDPYFHVR
uniref:Receptor ligand binding region domain-containing protein n=1 Tax=Glossina austeni TaxID=7395 RepID=A0A1A9V4Z1_GLOAU